MADFLNIYVLDPGTGLKKTAVLQNAFSITETQELNKIYTLEFTIPATDEKTKYILPFHFVRYGDKGQLYRIIKVRYADNDKSLLIVSCEHVIALLCDELMFGAVQYGGGTIKTSRVISYLLDQQKIKNWGLKDCDFDRKFEYLWEQENILNALYSIPKEFTKAYKWTFDTSGYPWYVSLKAINENDHPEYYIREKRNLLSSGTDQDYAGICTRIYPLGYGEGVNQLTIEEAMVNSQTGEADTVNGTKYRKTYIESPQQILAQYGIKEKILVDRRFENAESLYTYGKTMLEGLQTPSMARSFDVVDLYPLTSQDIDRAEVGKICRMTVDNSVAYITKTVRVLDDPGNLQIELSTKATDVVSTIADLADRVRIESVYAQGATQLYQHSKDANATPQKGMIMSLYFPSEMRQINKVLMRLKLGKFRSYSQTTSSNGGFSQEYTVSEKSQTYSVAAKEQTYSVAESSQNYSVDAKEQTYSVAESSQDYSVAAKEQTYSVAESSQDYSIAAKEQTITASVSKTATTDMTADSGQSLTTTKGGGGTGTTGVNTGKGNMNISISGSAVNTGEANWAGGRMTHKTRVGDNGALKADANGGGTHMHNINGSTGEVTPPASANYKHGHAMNFDIGYSGAHSHTVYESSWSDGHSHSIDTSDLQHNHSVTINVSSNVQGQSGFEHTHSFTLGDHSHDINIAHQHKYDLSHSHSITIPGHSHTIKIPGHSHKITIPGHSHAIKIPGHSHKITIPGHSHTIKIPGHSHKITIPAHSHTITIPGHSHTVTIPAHAHEIAAGIFESGRPTAFDIFVNGSKKTTVRDTAYEGDITAWLLDSSKQIPRDRWIDLEIRPNDLAYVQSSVFIQGFVQSRGGGNY